MLLTFSVYGGIKIRIIAGSTIRGKGDVTYDTEKMIVHPDYDINTNDFDVAILKISDQFNGPNMMQIPLTDVTDIKSVIGQEALVTGWGNLAVNVLQFHKIINFS